MPIDSLIPFITLSILLLIFLHLIVFLIFVYPAIYAPLVCMPILDFYLCSFLSTSLLTHLNVCPLVSPYLASHLRLFTTPYSCLLARHRLFDHFPLPICAFFYLHSSSSPSTAVSLLLWVVLKFYSIGQSFYPSTEQGDWLVISKHSCNRLREFYNNSNSPLFGGIQNELGYHCDLFT